MTREWQPGDVAMAPWPQARSGEQVFSDQRVVRYESGWALAADPDDYLNDGYGWSPSESARPLVVIDPENREQLERIARTTHVALTGDVPAWSTLSGKDQVRRMDALAMALDAELKPSKPEEPMGAGATVEDDRGDWWIRVARGADGAVWHLSGFPEVRAPYADINAVRVLSDGVQP